MSEDPVQARDVARWRKAERERLMAERLALSVESRSSQAKAIAEALDRLIPLEDRPIISVYWPIRAEPDLRSWMRERCDQGARIALPVAIELGRPLIFREWRPQARMARGLWKIPFPADGEIVTPQVVLAPVVGFDSEGYRLGYGGGFFDRTLAVLRPRPLIIGVGYECARLKSIYPQRHDIPMDWIITGSAPLLRSSAPASREGR